jgi:hypothetical protein
MNDRPVELIGGAQNARCPHGQPKQPAAGSGCRSAKTWPSELLGGIPAIAAFLPSRFVYKDEQKAVFSVAKKRKK